MGELAQLDGRALGVVERLGDELGTPLVVALERLARQLQRDHRVDEALLRSVVQVAHHAPALRRRPRPRSAPATPPAPPAPDVRDRCRDQLGELGDPRLGVRRAAARRGARRRRSRPRAVRRRRSACRPRSGCPPSRHARAERRRWRRVVVDPRGPAGLDAPARRCCAPRGRPRAPTAKALAGSAPVRDDRRRPVGLVAGHPRGVHVAAAAPTSSATAANTSPAARLARDQRRHAPQRGLLVGEPPHLRPRLGVRDRRGDELGERLDPRLGVRRQRPVAPRRGVHHAPQPLVDDDRRAHRRADAQLPAQRGRGPEACS